MLHLRQFVFPLACELWAREFIHLQAAQQSHQLKSLRHGDEFTAFAHQVFFSQQAFNNRRPCGRRAQAFFLHGGAQLVILYELARAFHCAQ